MAVKSITSTVVFVAVSMEIDTLVVGIVVVSLSVEGGVTGVVTCIELDTIVAVDTPNSGSGVGVEVVDEVFTCSAVALGEVVVVVVVVVVVAGVQMRVTFANFVAVRRESLLNRAKVELARGM